MINVIEVQTWEACQVKIEELKLKYPNRRHEFLFRGQSNAGWELATTLERRPSDSFSFVEYYNIVRRIQPEIEVESGLRWEMPSFDELSSWAKCYDRGQYNMLAYEYLAHLRHNGFPSPLLDWSRSAYVAAYFAFSGVTKSEGAVAIGTCQRL